VSPWSASELRTGEDDLLAVDSKALVRLNLLLDDKTVADANFKEKDVRVHSSNRIARCSGLTARLRRSCVPEKMIFWLSTAKPWSASIFFLRSATCV
jgi:hypothetical protein